MYTHTYIHPYIRIHTYLYIPTYTYLPMPTYLPNIPTPAYTNNPRYTYIYLPIYLVHSPAKPATGNRHSWSFISPYSLYGEEVSDPEIEKFMVFGVRGLYTGRLHGFRVYIMSWLWNAHGHSTGSQYITMSPPPKAARARVQRARTSAGPGLQKSTV